MTAEPRRLADPPAWRSRRTLGPRPSLAPVPTGPDVGAGGGPTRAGAEQRLLEEATRDLQRQFPTLSSHQVSVVVECIWAEFDDAPIRDFVPLLVLKQAREELRDHFDHSDHSNYEVLQEVLQDE